MEWRRSGLEAVGCQVSREGREFAISRREYVSAQKGAEESRSVCFGLPAISLADSHNKDRGEMGVNRWFHYWILVSWFRGEIINDINLCFSTVCEFLMYMLSLANLFYS